MKINEELVTFAYNMVVLMYQGEVVGDRNVSDGVPTFFNNLCDKFSIPLRFSEAQFSRDCDAYGSRKKRIVVNDVLLKADSEGDVYEAGDSEGYRDTSDSSDPFDPADVVDSYADSADSDSG